VGGSCRSLCSAKSCCQLPLSDTDSITNDPDDPAVKLRSLDSRTLFGVDPNTVDAQIVQTFSQPPKVALIYTSVDESGDTTSQWKPITARSPAWSMGLTALCGCTTLIVHSQNGVYGAHFFEDMAWGEAGVNGGFQSHVTDFLTGTGQAGTSTGSPGTLSLADVSARLTRGGAQVAAYILAPTAELPDDDPNAPGYIPNTPMYQAQLNALVALLPTIIPGIQVAAPNLYEALEGGQENGVDINPQHADLLDNHARGRVLVQFDPQNNGFRTLRLFFETNLIFTRQLGAST